MTDETSNPHIDVDAMPVTEGRCRDRMEAQTEAICKKVDTLRKPVEELMAAYTEEKGRRAGRAEARRESTTKTNTSTRVIGLILTAVALLAGAVVFLVSRIPNAEEIARAIQGGS